MTLRDLDQRCRRRRPRRSARTRGFSLIEVVVAAGIFALVAGVLFSALWAGRSHLTRLEQAGSTQEQMLALRRVLTAVFEAATVAGTSQDPGATVFSGDGDLAVFHSTAADRGQPGGLTRIELAIERSEEAGRLVSRVILRRQALGVASAPVEATELLALPRLLAFRYSAQSGPVSAARAADWAETWSEPAMLPARVQLADPDGAIFTVAVAQSKDPRCILKRGAQMLASGECRVR